MPPLLLFRASHHAISAAVCSAAAALRADADTLRRAFRFADALRFRAATCYMPRRDAAAMIRSMLPLSLRYTPPSLYAAPRHTYHDATPCCCHAIATARVDRYAMAAVTPPCRAKMPLLRPGLRRESHVGRTKNTIALRHGTLITIGRQSQCRCRHNAAMLPMRALLPCGCCCCDALP